MKTYGMPEREYLHIYKRIKKLELQFQAKQNAPVLARRLLKKVVSLLKRAQVLEAQMMVPEDRRFTKEYC